MTRETENRNDQDGRGVSQQRNAKEAVYAMLGSQLQTTLSDGRVVQGRLQCMDRLTNFILADAVETGRGGGGGGGGGGENGEQEGSNAVSEARAEGQPGAQQRHLGVVMIPGKHLVSVKRLGGCT
eukprot:g8473.t1